MSEREEQFILKAETLLDNIKIGATEAYSRLERTRKWYQNAAVSFAISIVVFASIAGVVGYRLGAVEKTMASKKSVELLIKSQQAANYGMKCLVEDKYKEGVDYFIKEKKVIDDNIWMFTSEIRGGK